MRGKRILWFLVMIAFGLLAGLFYGWVISPPSTGDTAPDKLRADYKADYVLMVAETYHADQNLVKATQRLTLLGSESAAQITANGIQTARDLDYTESDLQFMDSLLQALKAQAPTANPGGAP